MNLINLCSLRCSLFQSKAPASQLKKDIHIDIFVKNIIFEVLRKYSLPCYGISPSFKTGFPNNSFTSVHSRESHTCQDEEIKEYPRLISSDMMNKTCVSFQQVFVEVEMLES